MANYPKDLNWCGVVLPRYHQHAQRAWSDSLCCAACVPGKYKENITVSTDEALFFNDTINSALDADICLPCPENTFSIIEALDDRTQCVACPVNSSAPKGSFECLCVAGYYDEIIELGVFCQPCPEGTYQDQEGVVGLASCKPCPDGVSLGPANTDADACVCAPGERLCCGDPFPRNLCTFVSI